MKLPTAASKVVRKFNKANIVRIVKKGRRTYGAVYKLADGNQIYVAYRFEREVYRNRELTAADAIRLHKASWAIDFVTLEDLRISGIKYLAVFVKNTGDIYFTEVANYYDRKMYIPHDFSTRGGTDQHYLPLGYFRLMHGKTKIR